MTSKMCEALRLLVEHGNGDVSRDDPTEFRQGLVRVNLATARALARRGYVHIESRDDYEVWGSIDVLPAGRAASGAEGS